MGRKPCARSYVWQSPPSQAAQRLVADSLAVESRKSPTQVFSQVEVGTPVWKPVPPPLLPGPPPPLPA